MRQSLALLALCAVLRGAGAGPADASGGVNHGAGGAPCTNTVNGVTTTATDVNGNIIKGCGNVVSNVTTDGINQVNVNIYGSDNVVKDDIVHNAGASSQYNISLGSESTTDIVSGDEVIGNVADYYIGVWHTNNSKLDRNVAAGPAGYMYLATDENVTVTGNTAVRGPPRKLQARKRGSVAACLC